MSHSGGWDKNLIILCRLLLVTFPQSNPAARHPPTGFHTRAPFFLVFIQTTQSLYRSLLLRDKLLLFQCLEKLIRQGNEFSDEWQSLQEMKTLEAETSPNGSAIIITEI